MSCPWRPPLETASDCPGQKAVDKASHVGLYWPCRAGALAPRQLLKNHTASSSRRSILGRHTRFAEPFTRVWRVWPKPCLLLTSCALRIARDAAAAHKARLMSESRPYGACCKAISSELGHLRPPQPAHRCKHLLYPR